MVDFETDGACVGLVILFFNLGFRERVGNDTLTSVWKKTQLVDGHIGVKFGNTEWQRERGREREREYELGTLSLTRNMG